MLPLYIQDMQQVNPDTHTHTHTQRKEEVQREE